MPASRPVSYTHLFMAIQNAYLQGVYEGLAKRNPEQKELLQAVEEVLESLEPVVEAHPEYEKAGLIERLVEPERIIMFRVPWAVSYTHLDVYKRQTYGYIYVAQIALGANMAQAVKVIAMSDSNGYIVDENGIDYKVIKEIKEVKRARIKTCLLYTSFYGNSECLPAGCI